MPRKPRRKNINSTPINNQTTTQQNSKKKVKRKDLRGPNWRANLDYIQSTSQDKKKDYPVVKGSQAFDLLNEYKRNPEKFSSEPESVTTSLTKILQMKNEPDKINLLNALIQNIEPDKVCRLPKVLNKLGYCALHYSCEQQNSNPEILYWILDTFNSIDLQIDAQNRFLQTPLHLAIQNSLKTHVKTLIEHNADPRVITYDGFNGLDFAKLNVPKEIDLKNLNINAKSNSTKSIPHSSNLLKADQQNAVDILEIVEKAIKDIEELEADAGHLNLEYQEMPKYPENVQKWLLKNGNHMQINNIVPFTRHLNGDMTIIQDSSDKRITVKIQKPSIGKGMLLVNNKDKSFYSFLLPDHEMYMKIVTIIDEFGEDNTRGWFLATPFDEYHLVIHEVLQPKPGW